MGLLRTFTAFAPRPQTQMLVETREVSHLGDKDRCRRVGWRGQTKWEEKPAQLLLCSRLLSLWEIHWPPSRAELCPQKRYGRSSSPWCL